MCKAARLLYVRKASVADSVYSTWSGDPFQHTGRAVALTNATETAGRSSCCIPLMFLSLARARSLGMMASGVMVPEPPTPPAFPAGAQHTKSRAQRQTQVCQALQPSAPTQTERGCPHTESQQPWCSCPTGSRAQPGGFKANTDREGQGHKQLHLPHSTA